MANYAALFEPFQIKGLTLRNRFVSTSHAPGYAAHGRITERYIRYHEEKAIGGIGLSQFGGATAVAPENSFYYNQVNGAVDDVIPDYRRMAAAIHRHGAKCTVQLTHGGRRERWDVGAWLPAFSSSCLREPVHGSFPAVMEDHDFARTARCFADAARRARDGDVDGVEVSCQAGTLIEQFWSPAMNRRTDGYGGSLANRMRLGLDVLEAIRKSVGDDYVVGIRMPGDEMMKGGLSQEDCIEIARTYAGSGLIDYVSVVGGHASTYKDEATIWPTMWLPSAAYLGLAGTIREAVDVPILHATRIADASTADHAVSEGHIDLVGMTRAMIADPHLVNKLSEGREAEIRPCVGIGYCVDRVVTGHDAYCAHNVATSREASVAHVIEPSPQPGRKVVIAGGGPAGLEAARVSAARGHKVVLFEAASELGGQMALAARATWRKGLTGLFAWLTDELTRLEVDIRMNTLATADDILAEAPDTVIVATGGLPNVGHFDGAGHVTTTWEILSGEVAPADTAIVCDEAGGHAGLSCAEFLATQGTKVRFITPETRLARELGGTNVGAHMTEIYKNGVEVTIDTRLASVAMSGNRLEAVVENTYSGARQTLEADQVIGEHGTLPNDDLYFELKPRSRNLGEVDLAALAANLWPGVERNTDGTFWLFRAGDAWTSRNMHAAMLDAMRMCMHL